MGETHIYGYLNKIRSSRKLHVECKRNLEVRWLIQGLTPCYHSIADFRKENALALQSVFRTFSSFLQGEKLVEGQVIGIDGSKFRAVNSKKNNYNQKKIDRHLAYIDQKLSELDKQLAIQPEETEKGKLQAQIQKHQTRKANYQDLLAQVHQSPDGQVSTTDAESRTLLIHQNIVEVSYNVQSAVDEKHKLIVYFQTTNRNDAKALGAVVQGTKALLGVESLTVLADKGYHNGEQLSSCQKENITTLVAYREFVERAAGPTPEYYLNKFSYDKGQDHYICPQGEHLTTNGNWYKKHHPQGHYLIKRYLTKACQTCPVKQKCTDRTYGRNIDRSEFQDAVEENNQRVEANKELYQKRKAICEHPFGTIKRGWGYSYTLLKGLQKVNSEMALIFLAYNLRRTLSILGIQELLTQLKSKKLATKLAWWGKIRAYWSSSKETVLEKLFQLILTLVLPKSLLYPAPRY